MRNSIWTFALLAVFLGIFIPALGGAFTSGGTTTSVANEATTISTDSWSSVDEDGVEYLDNETVYHNGSAVEESEYRWSTKNGSLQALENGTLADADEVSISYSVRQQSVWAQFLKVGVGVFFVVFVFMLLFAAGTFVAGAIGSGGGGR